MRVFAFYAWHLSLNILLVLYNIPLHAYTTSCSSTIDGHLVVSSVGYCQLCCYEHSCACLLLTYLHISVAHIQEQNGWIIGYACMMDAVMHSPGSLSEQKDLFPQLLGSCWLTVLSCQPSLRREVLKRAPLPKITLLTIHHLHPFNDSWTWGGGYKGPLPIATWNRFEGSLQIQIPEVSRVRRGFRQGHISTQLLPMQTLFPSLPLQALIF